jgi:hypothetical protein
LTSDGKLRFTGSDFLYASSEGKFGHLNNTVGVFEVEVNNQTGDTKGKTFEWKITIKCSIGVEVVVKSELVVALTLCI